MCVVLIRWGQVILSIRAERGREGERERERKGRGRRERESILQSNEMWSYLLKSTSLTTQPKHMYTYTIIYELSVYRCRYPYTHIIHTYIHTHK